MSPADGCPASRSCSGVACAERSLPDRRCLQEIGQPCNPSLWALCAADLHVARGARAGDVGRGSAAQWFPLQQPQCTPRKEVALHVRYRSKKAAGRPFVSILLLTPSVIHQWQTSLLATSPSLLSSAWGGSQDWSQRAHALGDQEATWEGCWARSPRRPQPL